MDGKLSQAEIRLAERCIDIAREAGASAVRVSLSKSTTDLVGILNGEVDKVTHSLDCCIILSLFVDGRFGSFSLNRLSDELTVRHFILEAVDTVRMLVPDPCRVLPAPGRKVTDAFTGEENGNFDGKAYEALDAARRLEIALSSSLWSRKAALEHGFTLLSEEGEYSDSLYDLLILDSEGLRCRHTETTFEIGYELTVADGEGNRFSGYWWDSAARLKNVLPSIGSCSERALKQAVAQIGPRPVPGGKVKVAVLTECASKLLNPLIAALNGYSIQQKNSFLSDSLGESVFSEKFTLRSVPRAAGKTGVRWFDSEGVATTDAPVIEGGVIKRYFINTYIAGKTGLEPTEEDAFRLELAPTGECRTLEELLALLGDGILVTGFNGGNNNSATGDFSYGIEGFAVSGGKILHPVREMLMTGNFISLWKHLLAVADDARDCLSRRIPSLAFTDVDIR